MNAISRLALFAYVVGGWLLPASHYHAHDHAAHSPCGQLQQVESVAGDAGHHVCDHRAEEGCPGAGPRNGNAEGWLVAAHDEIACHGLCALCSARSLAATATCGGASVSGRVPVIRDRVEIHNGWLPDSRVSQHLTRGPPRIG